eukprot:11588123-Alexandrium_andersonii.AAC.1
MALCANASGVIPGYLAAASALGGPRSVPALRSPGAPPSAGAISRSAGGSAHGGPRGWVGSPAAARDSGRHA